MQRTARTRTVECSDAFGRNAITRVTVDSAGKVLVTAPAGETGRFEPSELLELVAALNDALGTARDLGSCRVVS